VKLPATLSTKVRSLTASASGSALESGSDPGPGAPGPDAELLARRERLTERFVLMQSELGGLFYEMAIRDHVKLDVLVTKAAAMQRVDAELAQVEHLISQEGGAVGGRCPNCGTAHARGAAFCSQCATPLLAG
jgi:zinc-ribbon domain